MYGYVICVYITLARSNKVFEDYSRLHIAVVRSLLGVPAFCGIWTYMAYSASTYRALRLVEARQSEPTKSFFSAPILVWILLILPPLAVVTVSVGVGATEDGAIATAARYVDQVQTSLTAGNLTSASVAAQGFM